MAFQNKLQELSKEPFFPASLIAILKKFYKSYKNAVEENGIAIEKCQEPLLTFLDLIAKQLRSPFIFAPYHQKIRQPKDLYRFGLDFIAPLVQISKSTILGMEIVEEIAFKIGKGENAILLANHQTEPDPQAISLLLEHTHPELVEKMIFIAGHRVTTDPLAVPFSMGCNLLCIYSKNYIDHPPEKKGEKILHNQRTMKVMRTLLSEGGKCIYVAPSGGRDRPNASRIIEITPFDYQSIEMFSFIASHSKTPTSFYPLALNTHRLLPPPDRVREALGEARLPGSAPIHLAFGKEILFDELPIPKNLDKKAQRAARTRYIQLLVNQLYQSIS